MSKKKLTVSELADQKRNQHFPIKFKDYKVEVAERDVFYKEQTKIFKKVFPPTGVGFVPNKKEDKALDPCYLEYRKIHSERFLITHKGKVIGWMQGEMEDFETFYMRNTGILPAHQDKGIYKKFLKEFENYIFGLGYARISSQHAPTNARIISLKLKAKYVIVGSETHERWGKLVKLVKFKSQDRYDYYFKKVD
nr:GNAT family N-acetyltransferase [Bacteriovorax sp. HI3]